MNDTLEEQLLDYCRQLTKNAQEDQDEGFAFWPDAPTDRNQCGICTNGARLVSERFGGQVYGYPIEINDTPTLVAYNCLGHDFAVVAGFLIDWWGWDYENAIPSPVLHLERDKETIRGKYKPQTEWVRVSNPTTQEMYFERDLDAAQLNDLQALVSPLLIVENVEGQTINELGEVVLGCRAGPSIDLQNALHEICHFIEIDRRRMTKPGWGLKHGKWIRNPHCRRFSDPPGWHIPSTDAHIQRETRVWSMQVNLSQHRGLPINAEDLAQSARFMPEFYSLVPGKTEQEKIRVIIERIEQCAAQPQFQPTEILKELNDRRCVLQRRYSRRRHQMRLHGTAN